MPDSTLSGLTQIATLATNDLFYVVDVSEVLDAAKSKKMPLSLFDSRYQASGNYATAAQGLLADTAVQPDDLASVAFSGDYGDLINTPTLFSGDYNDLLNLPTLGELAAEDWPASDDQEYVAKNGAWVVSSGGGSSLPVVDTTAIVKGSSDDTKQLRFEVDGFTTGQTRVLTPPNANATIAGLEIAQSWTQKNDYTCSNTTTPAITIKDVPSHTGHLMTFIRSDNLDMIWVDRGTSTLGAINFRNSSGSTASIGLYNQNGSINIAASNANAIFRLLPSGDDIFFQNTIAAGDIFFTGLNSGYLLGQSVFRTNGAIVEYQGSDTNIIRNLMTLRLNSTATPVAGYGSGLLFQGKSSTTLSQDMARFTAEWATATHASRKALSKWFVYDTAAREAIRVEASGTAAMIGFLGASAIARQAHIADPSGGATQDTEARTAINAILAALENFGFLATS